MGYSSLSILGSDTASDAFEDIINGILKFLKQMLKETGNDYNTDGLDNVAMVFHEVICPHKELFCYNDALIAFARKVSKKLDDKILDAEAEDWGDKSKQRYHLKAYGQWRKSINSLIAEAFS